MNRTAARMLTRLYPRVWRERYGREFTDFLEDRGGGLGMAVNVVWSAVWERIFPTIGGSMDTQLTTFGTVLRRPSAFAPLAMSGAALALVLGAIAFNRGVPHDTDEGAVAHLWQILMVAQMPVILFFALRWLPRAPRQSWPVLAIQVGAVLAAMAPVFLLGL